MKSVLVLLAALLSTLAVAAPAYAQRHEHERVPFHTPHMVFDDRFHHNHYYPVPGYSMRVLYYTQAPGGYVVADPPMGVAAAPAEQAPTAQAAAPAPGGAPSGTWYYCESSKTYYPYASECKEGWRAVPAAPPPAR